jgi:release factor glutamine methyltransferase
MQYKQILLQIKAYLAAVYEPNEAKSIAWRLLCFHYKATKLQIVTGQYILNKNELAFLHHQLTLLVANTPIQYVLEHEYFCNLLFAVSADVLIPRPETEELVHYINHQHQTKNLSVLDIGTGSGCIAISLKHSNPTWQINACDISTSALQIAKKNSNIHQTPITFLELDILQQDILLPNKYDIIVSNPPYITTAEVMEMRNNVLHHEPHLALFVTNNDPLQFYKAIVHFAQTYLHPNGKLYLECNEIFTEDVKQLLQNHNFISCKIIKDMYEKDRFVVGEFLPN